MAFANKIGSLVKQGVSSNSSMCQAIRCMSLSASKGFELDLQGRRMLEPKLTTSFDRAFARSNSSFFDRNGQAFLASVLRLRRKKMFLVDAGLGTPINCLQNELTSVQNNQAARFEDKVGLLDVKAGEPLLLPRKFRQNRAWMELKKTWQTNKKVKGFLLDKVRGGYSVGIAGFTAFLPMSAVRRRWKSDQFTIARLHPKREDLLVYSED